MMYHFDIVLLSANEYQQSMFKIKSKNIMHTPVNHNFAIQNLGVRGLQYTDVLA